MARDSSRERRDAMPLVRVNIAGRRAEERERIGAAIHQALVQTANVPQDDLFQIFEEAPQRVAPRYLGIEHGKDVAIVQIFLNAGRTTEIKKALYARIADGVSAAAGIPREDVIVNLVEVSK